MPQMKPMNWINIFITMNLILMMMNINFYFNKKNMKIFHLNKIKKNMNNWKW